MNNLLLTSDRIDINRFREKYPTNILNLQREDIFKRTNIENVNDIKSYTQLNQYKIYDTENYNESLDKYQKLRENTINVSMDEYNKMFELNKRKLEQKIIDMSGQVTIKPDPYRTKYPDTYSITPYATYLLTDLAGDNIDHVVSRFDDCYGVWSDGYYNERNSEWYDSKKEKCYNKDDDFEACNKYTKYYRVLNPDFKGSPCMDDENINIIRNGDTRRVRCDEELCKEEEKNKKNKKNKK